MPRQMSNTLEPMALLTAMFWQHTHGTRRLVTLGMRGHTRAY